MEGFETCLEVELVGLTDGLLILMVAFNGMDKIKGQMGLGTC